jgi:hypothetical protein
MAFVRERTPDEARALLEVERAAQDFTKAQVRLEMARWNFHHLSEERERARQRGHLRSLRTPEPDRQSA